MNTKIQKLLVEAATWKGIVAGPRPAIVTIGRMNWPAVWYREECETPPGSRAYQESERTYVREGFYCLGELPALKRRGNAAFLWAGDSREWYVAGHSPKVIKREYRQYHRLGRSFILAPWDVLDGRAIDWGERHPYKRASMTVRWLDGE